MKTLSKEDLALFLKTSGLVYKTPFNEDDLLEAMNHAFKKGFESREATVCEQITLTDCHIQEISNTLLSSMIGYSVNGTLRGCITAAEMPNFLSKLREIKLPH